MVAPTPPLSSILKEAPEHQEPWRGREAEDPCAFSGLHSERVEATQANEA